MVDQVCQNLTCVLLIVAHLGTSIWMSECDHTFYVLSYKALGTFLDCLCHIVDTSDSWNDPDLITNTGASVLSSVTVEETCFLFGERSSFFIIGICKKVTKSCLHIVSMDPGTFCDICLRNSDGISIFNNGFTFGDIS